MKGLLLKDCYVLVKQLKIFLLMIVIFAVLPGFGLSGFAVVYASLLPITALAYDERSQWDTLAAMLPYSNRSLVLSKYLLGYLLTAAATLLSLAAQLAVSAVQNTPAELEALFALPFVFCIALLLLAVNLPAMFRLGVEKGRMVFLALMVVTVFLGMSLKAQFSTLFSSSPTSFSVILAVLVVGTAAANVLSVLISVRVYRTGAR